MADFNNDGKLDAAVGGGAGLALFFGNGDGTFQGADYVLTTNSLIGPAADFNRDGNVDLIINGTVYLGNGKGGFQPLSQATGLAGTVVDINGDGYLDLFDDLYYSRLANFPSIVVILGNGDGTFQAPTVLETGGKYTSYPGVGLTGDFNGDGRPDLAVGWSLSSNVPTQVGIQILLNTSRPVAPDFGIGPASGSSNSATITAGQTASFNLTVTPSGSFSGAVSLSCAITPVVTPAPVCTVPASVNVTVGTAAPVAVKVSTTAAGTAGSISQANPPRGMMPIRWTIVLLASGLLFVGYRRRIPTLAIPMIAVLFFGMAACGGGSTSPMTTPRTPAGTYTATVTAKSGSLNHSTALTVIVQ